MRREPTASDSASRVAEHLDALTRRISAAQTLTALAWGCGLAACVAVGVVRIVQQWPLVVVVSCVTVAVIVIVARIAGRRARSRAAAARILERGAPECRNVVITAEELLRISNAAPPWIVSRVLEDAARRLEGRRGADVQPLARPAIASVLALVVLGAVLLRVEPPGARFVRQGAARVQQAVTGETDLLSFTALIEPPPYIGRAPFSVENPEQLEVMQGSRIRLRFRGPVARVRYGTRTLPLGGPAQSRDAELIATESGYLAIEKPGAETGAARLIALAVTADRAPTVRIEAPGRDLLLPNASASVPVAVTADDDFGLRDLEIRYTRVSGSGERFDFEEGTLPASVSRTSERAWRGRTSLELSALKLQPGDSLVYRAVARDARPSDAGTASSDTFFIEIAGPGQVALAGFEMPPDGERYALSQQMIVVKIQRLLARQRSLTAEAVREQASTMAAEQRAVRANFVFLMGGHVEDEEEEAEQSHEIQEGRLETHARAAMSEAITHMTRAEQALAASQVSGALPPARAAVEALQRAFGRNRYFLRTIPVRNRIDPSRRLSGDATDARDWRRGSQQPSPDLETQAARTLLARLLDLAPRLAEDGQRVPPATATALAEASLAIAPSEPEWQQIGQRLQRLSELRPANEVQTEFASIVKAVAARLQRTAPAAPADVAAGSLRSAWAEVRR